MAKGHISLFWLGNLVLFYATGSQTSSVAPLFDYVGKNGFV